MHTGDPVILSISMLDILLLDRQVFPSRLTLTRPEVVCEYILRPNLELPLGHVER